MSICKSDPDNPDKRGRPKPADPCRFHEEPRDRTRVLLRLEELVFQGSNLLLEGSLVRRLAIRSQMIDELGQHRGEPLGDVPLEKPSFWANCWICSLPKTWAI